MRARAHALALAVVALPCALVASCALTPDAPREGEPLPNAGLGPFRELVQSELGESRVAPAALSDRDARTRDGAVLDDDGDPATLGATGYFASLGPDADDGDPAAPTPFLVRHHAADGRSFERPNEVVLEADPSSFEGSFLSAPSALRVGGAVWVYYAAEGGIGLAIDEGAGLSRVGSSPVLAMGPEGVPRAPSVVLGSDGRFHLYYEAGGDELSPGSGQLVDGARVFVATSDDGLAFEREGEVLGLGPEGSADARAVGHPFAIVERSPFGRPITHLFYAARDEGGLGTIGLASRYDDAPQAGFVRAVSPVWGTSKVRNPRSPTGFRQAPPASLEGGGEPYTLLFVTQDLDRDDAAPVVAALVAPAPARLPKP
jgi:hypothetical protein